MKFPWKIIVKFLHFFFFSFFIFMIFFTEKDILSTTELIWSIILNSTFTIGIYYLVYYYLVPNFYLSQKYLVFILYSFICFLLSSFFRILWEQDLFALDFNQEAVYINFLYDVYIYHAAVILVASCLGITKDKFLMEKKITNSEKQKETDYSIVPKSKFNPHFLFSILNSIHTASFSGSTKTSDSILQLSRLLHYLLYDSEKEKITVSQELSSIEALASLYQLRYNHSLNLAVDVGNKDVFDRIEIPSSLFLNLFQSALQCSQIGENPDSFIKLTCKTDDINLFYEIVNFNGNNSMNFNEAESGLQSNTAVIHILEKYFPEKFDFFSEQEGNNHYKTIVKINLYS